MLLVKVYYYLTLEVSIPQNSQTHSNHSAATALKGLALKRIKKKRLWVKIFLGGSLLYQWSCPIENLQ